MTMRTREIQVHAGSGNVYADLGFPNAAAMLRKAKLVWEISKTMRRKRLSRARMAGMFGMRPSEFSAVLRGQFRRFPERRLIACLERFAGAKVPQSPIASKKRLSAFALNRLK
jgi:predicted XRE-type DNA-binding protein